MSWVTTVFRICSTVWGAKAWSHLEPMITGADFSIRTAKAATLANRAACHAQQEAALKNRVSAGSKENHVYEARCLRWSSYSCTRTGENCIIWQSKDGADVRAGFESLNVNVKLSVHWMGSGVQSGSTKHRIHCDVTMNPVPAEIGHAQEGMHFCFHASMCVGGTAWLCLVRSH